MTIEKQEQGSTLNVAVLGRLDTTTAPQLEAELKRSIDGITELARISLLRGVACAPRGAEGDEQAGQNDDP